VNLFSSDRQVARVERRLVRDRRFTCSGAFTLVELLVVITIIGILIALLLPAVQAAREAARRAQCQNNLKQIGLALLNYESSTNTFPPAVIAYSGDTTTTTYFGPASWSWGAFILPYLEQGALYDNLGVERRTLAQAISSSSVTLQTKMASFRCPSDDGSATCGSSPLTQTRSNYVAVYGTGRLSTKVPGGGMFHRNSKTRIADIKDGTSHTIVIGERQSKSPDGGDLWACVFGTYNYYIYDGNTGWGYFDYVAGTTYALINSESVWYAPMRHGFSSNHPEGTNFLFADGSVQFVDENIDTKLYGYLANIDDGHTVKGY
jgi:prepilin-type N-terminal cleavage/methylation domain-containing protein/prepilin-type processing-associated H-X9-DG protein